MKARIRFTSPKGLDGENAIITIIDMEKTKVEVIIPMKSLMHAAGIDCDMEITDISGRNK